MEPSVDLEALGWHMWRWKKMHISWLQKPHRPLGRLHTQLPPLKLHLLHGVDALYTTEGVRLYEAEAHHSCSNVLRGRMNESNCPNGWWDYFHKRFVKGHVQIGSCEIWGNLRVYGQWLMKAQSKEYQPPNHKKVTCEAKQWLWKVNHQVRLEYISKQWERDTFIPSNDEVRCL